MPRRLLRSRSIWVLLFMGGLLFAAWWFLRPIATLTLPDGTKLHLMKITVGTSHPYKLPVPPNSSVWTHLKHVFTPAQVFQTERSVPVFHFKRVDPPHKANGDQLGGVISYLSDGTLVAHRRGYPEDEFYDLSNPEPSPYIGAGPLLTASKRVSMRQRLIGVGEVYLLVDPLYDRRQDTFPVHISWLGVAHPWILPNPLRDHPFPEWQPESFPIRRTIGDFRINILCWNGGPRGVPYLYTYADFFKTNGAPVSIETLFTDATGQTSVTPMLSLKETAWRAEMSFVIGDDRPMNDAHRLTIPGIAIPAPGQHTEVQVPPVMQTHGVRYIAVVGPGTYTFENGRMTANAPSPIGDSSLQDSAHCQTTGDRWKASVTSRGYAIVQIVEAGSSSNSTDYALRSPLQVLRRQTIINSPQVTHGYYFGDLSRTNATKVDEHYSAHAQALVAPSNPKGAFPPATFDLQYYWPEAFKMEVLVPPPPVQAK